MEKIKTQSVMISKKLRKFAQKERRSLEKWCPDIYKFCFAHLSDEEMLAELSRRRAELLANRGKSIPVKFTIADGRIIDCGEFTVPGREELN
jgi:hypothetical protein